MQVEDAARRPRVPMAIRPFSSQWATEAHLEELGAVRIRPIRPEDESLYKAEPGDASLRHVVLPLT